MATLLQDIKTQSEWIVKAFAADKLKLDYSIQSFIEIDKFFNQHSKEGQAVKGGRLAQDLGPIMFSIGSYVGQTIIKNVPGSVWITDDKDMEGEFTASVKLPDGTQIFPMQRIVKRFQNGPEDAIYVYGHHITNSYTNQPFDQSFWQIMPDEKNKSPKPWWRFWSD